MLTTNWRILRFWKNAAGIITTVQYETRFTADEFPGVESLHGGISLIEPLQLPIMSETQDIIDGLVEILGSEHIAYLEAVHSDQLVFEYSLKSNEVVEVEPREITSDDIDTERDRRIAAGFMFDGKLYQSRPDDRENISGAAVVALAAQISGAQPGNLRWHGGASDFEWIAEDNSLTLMDAQTMFIFGQAAMAHKQAHIFFARLIKDTNPIPSDYADDIYWQEQAPAGGTE